MVENARVDLLPDPIIDAMRDPARTFQMGQRGRKHIQDNYAWEKTATTILGRLEKLIRERQA